jgi:hypothetical protein
MSYSYIKNVFPEFQVSTAYDDLNNVYNKPKPILTVPQGDSKFQAFEDKNDTLKEFDTQATNQRIVTRNTQDIKASSNDSKDNLRFYNLEQFQVKEPEPEPQVHESPSACDSHIKHVLECSLCSNILKKQYNIANDKLQMEEIMEVVSYVAFGIFIIIFIDTIQRKDNSS